MTEPSKPDSLSTQPSPAALADSPPSSGTLLTARATGRWSRQLEGDLENWLAAFRTLYHRFRDPLGRPKATLYFLLAIALFGALEVWTLLILLYLGIAHERDLAISLTTYAITVCIAALADAVLDKRLDSTAKLGVVLATFVTIIASLGFGYLVSRSEDQAAALSAVPAAVLTIEPWSIITYLIPAWLLWWGVSASDDRFLPDTNTQAAVGGDALAEL